MPKAVENLIYNVQQLLHNQHVKYSWSMQARLRGKSGVNCKESSFVGFCE